MPVFHTKTIESILEPVAVQVSRLVILHEEAEDGSAMPDLTSPTRAVSKAVENLVRVGKETIAKSNDQILRADLPASLQRVERASKLLEDAAAIILDDPYSKHALKLLIEGARGILQGTSSLLLCFDDSEVRRLVNGCYKILNYMKVAEVIERMSDLVQYANDLTPELTRVSRDVKERSRELTHQVHRETLLKCLESLKQLAPGLISSVKVYVHLLENSKSNLSEAAANRDYLTSRISAEVNEMIRVLQLTTYDDDEYDADSMTYMKRAFGAMTSKLQSAHDWCEDAYAPNGGIGEKALRQIIEHAEHIADRCALQADKDAIYKLCGDLRAMANALCELRNINADRHSPQAQSLSRNINAQLRELISLCKRAITNAETSGNVQPAHMLSSRVDQAHRWLNNLAIDDFGLGEQAVQSIVDEARRLALELHSAQLKQQILNMCNEAESLKTQLANMCQQHQANNRQHIASSPQAQNLARQLNLKLRELQRFIRAALVNRVVDDYIDATLPLRQFSEVVTRSTTTTTTTTTSNTTANNSNNVDNHRATFESRAQNLIDWSSRASQTARHVATNSVSNKRLGDAITSLANELESLTPQLIKSGNIRFQHFNSATANENFNQMRNQYESDIVRLRSLIDEATDSASFVKASEQAIRRHAQLCELAISTRQVQSMVDNAASIARLANRVIMVARQETNNSEDSAFISKVESRASNLQNIVPNMVKHAKDVAQNIGDLRSHTPWRQCNNELIDAVASVGQSLSGPQHQAGGSSSYNSQSIDDYLMQISSTQQLNQQQQRRSSPNLSTQTTRHVTTKTTTTTTQQQQQQQHHPYQHHHPPQQQPMPQQHSPSARPSSSGYDSHSPIQQIRAGSSSSNAHNQPQQHPQIPQHKPQHYSPSVPHHHHQQQQHPQHQQQSYQSLYNQPPPPPRQQPPLVSETDDEFEEKFPVLETNQPIMMAAHDLHQEVKQWSSKENEIIAAAKKIALLMARLSQLVRGESGTKKDLISCAKAIADASQEVTRLAKEQAKLCTDRKMRTNILQVCERIPTMGTQLRILSTVKATMLGVQGDAEEDQEAMEMIVGNAQNLMQSIKETVRACEAASIKIRTDQGVRVIWARKAPWFT